MTKIADAHRSVARKIWDAGHDRIRGEAMGASWVAQQAHIEALSAYVADHDRRVTELLAANNREVENRRALAQLVRESLYHLRLDDGAKAYHDKAEAGLKAIRR